MPASDDARRQPRRPPVWLQAASLGLSLVAVGVASYLTVTHYTDPAALACPDTGIVNCTLVTTSSWSVVLGVPLAVLGLVWAVVMTGLTSPWAWRAGARWVDGARVVVSARRRRHGALPRVRGALPHRGHLPVVHGHTCHGRVPLRGDPRRAGGLVAAHPGRYLRTEPVCHPAIPRT